ncbi:MAG: tetratricopeptide repeat protein [Gammaproteobacteria bacterium]|nr:tetratricopeptide repeat protein [Gammaproteobacteria bacterium]
MRVLATVLLSCVLGTCCLAADDDLFSAAEAAFKAGEFATAATLFEQALQAGDDSTALRYNLGVVYFRQGQLAAARQNFESLLDDEGFADWARYNIALIDRQQGNGDDARDGFAVVARTSSDAALAALATQQLQTGSARASTKPTLSGSLSLAGGYNDNVVDPVDIAGTDRGDHFIEIVGTVSTRWGDTKSPWHANAIGYVSRYDDIRAYNVSLFAGGVGRAFQLHDWQLDGGVEYRHLLLDDSGYLGEAAAKITATHALPWQSEFRINYEFASINSLNDDYDMLAGDVHRLNIDLTRDDHGPWYGQLRYRMQLDDRADRETPTSYTSFSALRHEVGGRVGRRWGPVDVSVDAGFRHSRFLNDNVLPGLGAIRRKDKLLRVGGIAQWRLDDHWTVIGEARYSDNRSTVDFYDYQQLEFTLGVERTF